MVTLKLPFLDPAACLESLKKLLDDPSGAVVVNYGQQLLFRRNWLGRVEKPANRWLAFRRRWLPNVHDVDGDSFFRCLRRRRLTKCHRRSGNFNPRLSSNARRM